MAAGRKQQRHKGHVRVVGLSGDRPPITPKPYVWSGPEGLADQGPSPVDETIPLTPAQAGTVGNWSVEYPEQAYSLALLREHEPERFLKALESIRAGRGRDVAQALVTWHQEWWLSVQPEQK